MAQAAFGGWLALCEHIQESDTQEREQSYQTSKPCHLSKSTAVSPCHDRHEMESADSCEGCAADQFWRPCNLRRAWFG